ncbi:MAG: hypothetical protein IJU29_03315 [Oscillospiraceae bacterium]|nr:hypothetical protein [Oscillospiraceae bacterium]
MATSKIQTGLRLNERLYDKIRELAVIEQRSMNNLMEYALQQYVNEYEKQNGVIPISSDD